MEYILDKVNFGLFICFKFIYIFYKLIFVVFVFVYQMFVGYSNFVGVVFYIYSDVVFGGRGGDI